MIRPFTNRDSDRYWWDKRGNPHRKGGPAIEMSDGRKQWWKKGRFIRGSEPKEVMFPGYRRISS